MKHRVSVMYPCKYYPAYDEKIMAEVGAPWAAGTSFMTGERDMEFDCTSESSAQVCLDRIERLNLPELKVSVVKERP